MFLFMFSETFLCYFPPSLLQNSFSISLILPSFHCFLLKIFISFIIILFALYLFHISSSLLKSFYFFFQHLFEYQQQTTKISLQTLIFECLFYLFWMNDHSVMNSYKHYTTLFRCKIIWKRRRKRRPKFSVWFQYWLCIF